MIRFEKIVYLAALIALFGYALCCRPAWSPDSSAVAFQYLGKAGSGIALHHVKTGRTENLLTFAGEMRESVYQVFWYQNRIMVLGTGELQGFTGSEENDHMGVIMDIDPGTRAFHRIGTLDFGEVKPSPIMPPVVDPAGRIWLGAIESKEHGLAGLDPGRGKVRFVGPARVFLLDRAGDGIFYLSLPSDKGDSDPVPEIGRFDPGEESFEKLAEVKKESLKEMSPFFAAAPDGSSVSAIAQFEDNRFELVIVPLDGQKPRWFALPDDCNGPGGIAFSRDGRTLWHLYFPKMENTDQTRPILAAFDPKEGLKRKKELPVTFTKSDMDMAFGLQPALSPDGRWLAVSTELYADEEQDGTSRLILVDLQSKELETRSVHPPPLPGPDR